MTSDRPADRVPVILLHGLGRSRLSLWPLARELDRSGFRAEALGYPALRRSVAQLSESHLRPLVERLAGTPARPVHFVTHSLGGIVLRKYLQLHSLAPGSRAVMLAPPNQGSELADFFGRYRAFRWATGPAGTELGTGAEDGPRRLPPVDIEVGIVAGRRSATSIADRLMPGDHDGKVSVRSTTLPEMRDFLVVDAGHTFIMYHGRVRKAVLRFLRNGSFAEPS